MFLNNTSKNQYDYEFKLILFSIFLLFIFKLVVIKDPGLIITTFIFESLIFLLIFLLFYKFRNRTADFIFYIFYFVHFITSILNTYYIQDILFRKLSLLSLDWGSILFFIKNILPLNLMIVFVFAIIILLTVPRFVKINFKFNKYLCNKNYILSIILIIFFLVIIPLISGDHFTSPYVNSFRSINFTKQEVNVYDYQVLEDINYDSDFNYLFSEIEYPDSNMILDYNRVLVFVAESLPTNKFELELKLGDEDNFFNKVKDKSIFFDNYSTNNQDSRTAVMSMLSGIFIPYESYRHADWYGLYAKKVLNKNNLVDYFNSKGYSTEFMISSIETPIVGAYYNWQVNHNIDDKEEYNKFNNNNICMHVLEYQYGCEDMDLLDDLKDLLKNKDKLFFMQEFIFGHNQDYLSLSGMNRTQYYSSYLNKVYTFLEYEDLLDGTLIVFVGDHGSKEYNTIRLDTGYKVPLVLVSNNFESKIISKPYSHINFPEILYSVVLDNNKSNLEFPKIDVNYVLFYGSTSSNLFGFSKDRSYAIYNITLNPIVETYANISENDADYMYNLIYNYKKYFDIQK